ncbi:MAG: efflux RND transporter periplasmic adaptor subunit [Bryobacteraceae bacterium]|nr:efflux RND transporter periplasmic adaptor subunit [Bryobacteraceae bacterium]
MRGKWLLAGGVAVLLAIAAGSLTVYLRPPSEPPAPAPELPAAFAGTEAQAAGVIRARNVRPVAPSTAGILEEVFVAVGDEIYEGQLLAKVKSGRAEADKERAALEVERLQTRINNLESAVIASRLEASRAQAVLSRARDEFEKANKSYQRQQLLIREGATPRRVFEQSEKVFGEARAELESATRLAEIADAEAASLVKEIDAAKRTLQEKMEDLDEANSAVAAGEIKSPASGMLIAARAKPGDQVTADATGLFEIAVELSQLEVVMEPPPPVLARIKEGQTAGVRVAELADEELAGKVRKVVGNQVLVEFTAPNPAIRPGLTAQVRIRLD